MLKAYRGFAYAIAVGVLLQAAFIAYGVFSIGDGGTLEEEDNTGIGLHGLTGGLIIPLLTIILLVLSFFTKTKNASKRAGMVFGAVLIQQFLAGFGQDVPFLGALHGLNAFVILGSSAYAARLAAAAQTATGTTTPTVSGSSAV